MKENDSYILKKFDLTLAADCSCCVLLILQLQKNGKRSWLHKWKVYMYLSINCFKLHSDSGQVLKGFTATHSSTVEIKQAAFQSTEYLPTITATERVTTATATIMKIRVSWSERHERVMWEVKVTMISVHDNMNDWEISLTGGFVHTLCFICIWVRSWVCSKKSCYFT